MDLRTYISELVKLDWLTVVERRVNWKFEIGEIARGSFHPLLFTNIKDYPGQSVFTGGLGRDELVSLSMGVNTGAKSAEIAKVIRQRTAQPLEPVVVKESLVLKNVQRKNSIDINRFAVPWWSNIDGGRFIGTWHLNITKNIQTGKRNVGVYRMQVMDKRRATVSVSPRSHLAHHMALAEKESKPLEMAVAIGVDELAVMAAGGAFDSGVDEYCMAGALMQRPLELINCLSVDLEVPASSEIILEGVLLPHVRISDGPYLDYAGVPSSNPQAFLFEITSVMYRDDPIFRGTSVGMPGGEDHHMLSLLAKAGLVDFHGSRIRHVIQNVLLKNRMYKAFQMSGRIKNKS
ncbi:3-polyprenyl-4-hydroxybenzoate decarboxylase [Chitinispirillum alkaliphilum]|nr:3-polyprenyl-4-hydroxybenzoate decarboxylase [Chitinispirillum alkaliphilum]